MKDIVIKTNSVESVIHCGSGSFKAYAPKAAAARPFIITDSNVHALYGELISKTFVGAPVHVFPAGERSKNAKTLFGIFRHMIEAGVTRSSTVVAIGGGVVGDVAGLAASLFMRGVKLVQIPTTLLAQVDSSVGGKTAIDFKNVKNIIGTFYQPSEVIVEPLFLRTLPAREVKCGLGEIVKYGALDKQIYSQMTNNSDRLFSPGFAEDITYDCVAHKAKVVKEDEKDSGGLRKTLNLGHTTGHAFELYYKRRSHGEFVLIGMFYELYIAEKKGVCVGYYAASLKSIIKKILKKVPAFDDVEKAARYAKFDKKNDVNSVVSIIVPHIEGESAEIKLPIEEYVSLITECRDKIKEGAL